jgi:hypothetical protein
MISVPGGTFGHTQLRHCCSQERAGGNGQGGAQLVTLGFIKTDRQLNLMGTVYGVLSLDSSHSAAPSNANLALQQLAAH